MASAWLCDTFGFAERLRAGDHLVQLSVGDAAVALTEQRVGQGFSSPDDAEFRPPQPGHVSHSVMVRVEDVNRHHDHARERGASILQPPTDYPFGERQYIAQDLAGHRWTFSETIADVAPEDWGGTGRAGAGEASSREVAAGPRAGVSQASISPQLSVRRGRAAIEFYKAAVGAVEDYRVGGTDEHEVVAQLSVGNASFWVADEYAAAPELQPGVPGRSHGANGSGSRSSSGLPLVGGQAAPRAQANDDGGRDRGHRQAVLGRP